MALTVTACAALDHLNSFGVRARARRLVTLGDAAATDEALELLAQGPRRLVLGGGSNVLFTGDFDGTVLLVKTRGLHVLDEGSHGTIVEAAAGEHWDGFVRWTLARGLAGLENLSLIPGTVGASPIQNIGAYGVEVCERIVSLDAVHLESGERRTFAAAECDFGYRDSLFKRTRNWLIERVRFQLRRDASPSLQYGELREEIARAGITAPTTADVAQAVCALRRRKLPDPSVLGNAGSFFKNPVLAAPDAQKLIATLPGLPHWPAGERVKLSAAWLIEHCGWKGRREGDAGVHASHALVLVNHGDASGADLLALARHIQAAVRDGFGVELEPEPVIL